jgi:pimeloyl-ACP methyl ester carboxylesterase
MEVDESCPDIARIPGAEERDLMVDGVRMRYWHAGSGPSLLLIHGFMGYSFSWRFNVAALSKHFSVYAIDLPGCGFSERCDSLPGSLASDGEFVLRFMDALGIDQADILGTSRGGGVTIALAGLAAQRGLAHRIRHLILNSPINPWSNNGQLLTKLLATAVGGLCVLHVIPKLPFVLQRYFRNLYADPKRIAPGSVEGYEAGMQPAGTFQHLLLIVRSWHKDLKLVANSLPALADIPTLLLWGDRDTAVFLSSAQELHGRLRNSTVQVMHGVGHMPYEEVPDEFNRAVCDFLLDGKPATPLATGIAQQPAV